jgi:hypothetical protein
MIIIRHFNKFLIVEINTILNNPDFTANKLYMTSWNKVFIRINKIIYLKIYSKTKIIKLKIKINRILYWLMLKIILNKIFIQIIIIIKLMEIIILILIIILTYKIILISIII